MRAVQQSRRVLWKIHGDMLDSESMVFTARQYEERYKRLGTLLRVVLLNRPVLFIGCSLDTDRTVALLKAMQVEHKSVRHFAILPGPLTESKFNKRLAEMRRCGVAALWYPDGAHLEVDRWLRHSCSRAR